MYLTLEQVKKHLEVDKDYHGDDLYILDLISNIEMFTAQYLDCPLESYEGCDGTLDGGIVQAMLLQIGTMYKIRESVTELNIKEMPLGLQFLLSPYKNYSIA